MSLVTPSKISENFFTSGFPPIYKIAKHHPPNKVTNKWLSIDDTGEIDYYFNSLGYRDYEFNGRENNSIWCLGHSDTAGVGVSVKSIWPSVLKELSGIDCLNLGVAGAGWDTITRIAISGLRKYTPKAIVVIEPPEARREYVHQHNSQFVLPSLPNSMMPYKDFYKVRDHMSDMYNVERNYYSLKNACDAKSVALYVLDFPERNNLKKIDKSAEGTHIGPNTHRQLAEDIFNCLDLKN